MPQDEYDLVSAGGQTTLVHDAGPDNVAGQRR
jgi:hypothetical protein